MYLAIDSRFVILTTGSRQPLKDEVIKIIDVPGSWRGEPLVHKQVKKHSLLRNASPNILKFTGGVNPSTLGVAMNDLGTPR